MFPLDGKLVCVSIFTKRTTFVVVIDILGLRLVKSYEKTSQKVAGPKRAQDSNAIGVLFFTLIIKWLK